MIRIPDIPRLDSAALFQSFVLVLAITLVLSLWGQFVTEKKPTDKPSLNRKEEIIKLRELWLSERLKNVQNLVVTNEIWHLAIGSDYMFVVRYQNIRIHRRYNSEPTAIDIIEAICSSLLDLTSSVVKMTKPVGFLLVSTECEELVLEEIVSKLASVEIKLIKKSSLEKEEFECLFSGRTSKSCLQNDYPLSRCTVCKSTPPKIKQCNTCKSVYYCGIECASKDSEAHKLICKRLQEDLEEDEKFSSRDFNFSYYNKNVILYRRDIPYLLEKSKVHGVGLYKRLCSCFSPIPFIQIHMKCFNDILSLGPTTHARRFRLFGISEVWSGDGLKVVYKEYPDVDTWGMLYNFYRVPNTDPAALLFYFPMTLWYIIKNFISKDVETGNDNLKTMTLHILNTQDELDFIFTLKLITKLLPHTRLNLIFITDRVPADMELPGCRYSIIPIEEGRMGEILVSVNSLVYDKNVYNGIGINYMSYQGRSSVPTRPDAVVVFSSDIDDMEPSVEVYNMLAKEKQKVFILGENKSKCEAILARIDSLGDENIVYPPIINPFRQPARYKGLDNNIPAWKCGFICGFGGRDESQEKSSEAQE